LTAEGYGAYAARFGGAPAAPIATATANACATPSSGERPGCASTLDTALLGGGTKTSERLRALPGVLEVEAGAVDHSKAVRVVFDPKQIAYADLLSRWAPIEADGAGARVVFVTSDAQRGIAQEWSAHAGRSAAPRAPVVVRVVDTSAFARVDP
jgi:peptide methionine sulfoxide reductase msrA/msrB